MTTETTIPTTMSRSVRKRRRVAALTAAALLAKRQVNACREWAEFHARRSARGMRTDNAQEQFIHLANEHRKVAKSKLAERERMTRSGRARS